MLFAAQGAQAQVACSVAALALVGLPAVFLLLLAVVHLRARRCVPAVPDCEWSDPACDPCAPRDDRGGPAPCDHPPWSAGLDASQDDARRQAGAALALVRRAANRWGLAAVESAGGDVRQFRKGQVTLTARAVTSGGSTSRLPRLRLAVFSPAASTRLAFFECPGSPSGGQWRRGRTGDDDFDYRVLVFGLDPWTDAVLGYQARKVLDWISRHRASPAGHEPATLEVEVRKCSQDEIDEAIGNLIDAMRWLELTPGDAPVDLAANLLQDPVGGVRLRCLQLLAEHFPRHPETLKAVGRVAGIRAEEWGRATEGRTPVVRALELLVGSLAPAGLRAAALAKLPKASEPVALRETLSRALGDEQEEVRCAALFLVRQSRDVHHLHRVVRLLRQGQDRERSEAVRALVALGDARAEEALIETLHEVPLVLRDTVVRALGRFGTPRALAALRPLARQPWTLGPGHPVVEEAIQRIRNRHRQLLPGEVCLAAVDSAQGSLSVGTGPGEVSPVGGL